MPRCDSREEQARDIRTRNQQQKSDRSKQHVKIRLDVAHDLFVQWNDTHTSFRIRLRILLLKLSGDQVHLGLCLLLRNTRLEPGNRVEKVLAAVVIVGVGHVDNKRHKNLHRLTNRELQLKAGG